MHIIIYINVYNAHKYFKDDGSIYNPKGINPNDLLKYK